MKKGLLIASIASITAVAGGLAFAVANANKGIRFEAVKAEEKSIVFDGTHSLPSPAGVFNAPNSYQVTSYTGSGDPVDVLTKAIAPGSGGNRSYNVGGSYFMSNYDEGGSSNARLITEIGLNNVTALSVQYGTTENAYMECLIDLYDEDGSSLTPTISDNTGADVAITKTVTLDFDKLALEKPVRKIEIWAYTNATLDNGTYFIKSVSASWSC